MNKSVRRATQARRRMNYHFGEEAGTQEAGGQGEPPVTEGTPSEQPPVTLDLTLEDPGLK